LLVGFAAETSDVTNVAQVKRARKDCDWIIANDVSGDVMGGDENSVHFIDASGVDSWGRLSKKEVARRIAERVAQHLEGE
jgi:phosphopantothenoylcysteine decarboxylase/phosphopantothenate--cysteine ligase